MLPSAILVSGWSIPKNLYSSHVWKVLYKIFSFHPDWTKNIIAMSNSCFWLGEILKIFSSEIRRHNELLFCRNDVWEILYKISIFRADHTTNMAAIGSSWLWLTNSKKSSLKPFGQVNWNLIGSTYGKLYKVFSKQNDRWATQTKSTEPLVCRFIVLVVNKAEIVLTWS